MWDVDKVVNKLVGWLSVGVVFDVVSFVCWSILQLYEQKYRQGGLYDIHHIIDRYYQLKWKSLSTENYSQLK